MNHVISASRSLGVMIIHAPSDTMKYYEGTARVSAAHRSGRLSFFAPKRFANPSLAERTSRRSPGIELFRHLRPLRS